MNLASCSLLFYSPDTLLVNKEIKLNVLILIKFFIAEMIQAIKIFYINKDVSRFDPHVGDTACQIRAYRVFLLITQKDIGSKDSYMEIEKFKVFYNHIGEKLKQFMGDMNLNKNFNGSCKHQTFFDFLSERNLLFYFPEDVFFIMSSFFLTRFKITDGHGNSYIDYEKICNELHMSRKLVKKLVRYYQIRISTDSVRFVAKISALSHGKSILNYAIAASLKYDDNERKVLPCYLVMKILLEYTLLNDVPIFLIVERWVGNDKMIDIVSYFFNKKGNDKKLQIKKIDSESLCVVIRGMVEYTGDSPSDFTRACEDKIMEIGFVNIILANMATHPQYPGDKLNSFNINPFENIFQLEDLNRELNQMRNFSYMYGCCEANKSLFFIKHIFCGYSNNQSLDMEVNNDSYVEKNCENKYEIRIGIQNNEIY